MDETISIVCGSTLLFGTLFAIVFGFFAYQRYLRYKEIIVLAEKGLVSPRYESNGKSSLRWGITITFLGVALCMGLYPFGWLTAPGEFPLNFGPWMVIGLVPTFFGLSLLVVYYVTKRELKEEQKNTPPPPPPDIPADM
jgi:hypothetical protein